MKHKIQKLIVLFLFISNVGFGQDTTIFLTSKNVWRLPFLLPGISYEHRVGRHSTLVSAFNLSGYYGRGGNYGYTNTANIRVYQKLDYYSLNTSFSLGYRYFYNFEKRQKRGKSIKANSANYISIKSSYTFPPFLKQDPELYVYQLDTNQLYEFSIQNSALYKLLERSNEGPSISILWGIQRTYKRNFYLNFALGLGLRNYYFGPASEFTIGYTFFNH